MHYKTIVKNAGSKLGCNGFHLLEQFHHIVWFGDLNYRIKSLSADQVKLYMAKGELNEIWQADTLRRELRNHRVFYKFQEPFPRKDFYPTYKKKPDRRLDWARNPEDLKQASQSSHETCMSLLDQIYRTKYKEPFYKGGSVQDRIPSFCDRLLYRSLQSTSGQLMPEYDSAVLNCWQDSSFENCHNYGFIPHNLMGSDHSAIVCGLNLTCPNNFPTPPNEFDENGSPLHFFIQITNILVVKGNYKFKKKSKLTKSGRNIFDESDNKSNNINKSNASLPRANTMNDSDYNSSKNVRNDGKNGNNAAYHSSSSLMTKAAMEDEKQNGTIEWPTKMKFLFPAPFEIETDYDRDIQATVLHRNDLAAYHFIMDQIESESKKRITPRPRFQVPVDTQQQFQQTMQIMKFCICNVVLFILFLFVFGLAC